MTNTNPTTSTESSSLSGTTFLLVLFASMALLALGPRLYNLDHEPLHPDEIRQVQEVQAPLGDIVELSYRHTQPPLDYIIGKMVVVVAPATDFSQRLPAAVLGGLSVALLALILARLGMPIAAIAAGVLAAIHPLLIHYSQYARPYALPVFLVVATIALYQHWKLGHKGVIWVGVFALMASLAMLSRAIMPLLALAVLGVIGLIGALRASDYQFRKAVRLDPLTIVVLPAVFVFVWIPSFFALLLYGSNFLSGSDYDLWGRLALSIERIAEYGERALRPVPIWGVFIALAIFVLFRPVRTALSKSWYVWAPLLLAAPLFALAHSLTTREGQFFTDRYMVFLPIGLAVVVGISIEAIVRAGLQHRRSTAVVLGLGLASLYIFAIALPSARASNELLTTKQTADWREVGQHIQAIEQEGDVIIAIDTRTFRPSAFNFGFLSTPRYYDGSTPDLRPDDVALNPGNPAETAGRYHFVLFVPRLDAEATLPADWELAEYTAMLIVTTPPLDTATDRDEAWWLLSEYLRGDVSVMTRFGGYAMSQRWFGTTQLHQWESSINEEANKLGLSTVAEDWFERVDTAGL